VSQVCAKADTSPIAAWYDGVCARDYAQPYKGFRSLGTNFVSKDVAAAPSKLYPQLSCASEAIKNHFAPNDPMRTNCVSLRSIAERYVRGSMCGVSASGVKQKTQGFSRLSKDNWLNDPAANKHIEWAQDANSILGAAKVSGHDGFVPFHSCALRTREYKFGPGSSFYASYTNHQDGRCANGETKDDPRRQPCSWYSARVWQTRRHFKKIQQLKSAKKVGGRPSYPHFKYDDIGLKQHLKDQYNAKAKAPVKAQRKAKRSDGWIDPIVTQTKLNEEMFDKKIAVPPPPLSFGAVPPPAFDAVKQADDNKRQAARNELFYTHALAADEAKVEASAGSFVLGKRA